MNVNEPSNLSSQTNPRSFIFRLPTETLESIFIHGAHEHFSEHGGDHIRTAPSWVNVSYVCRHWRYVALNCSTLWTYLFITSPRWTEELLSRSKQAPLKVWATVAERDGTSPEVCFLDRVMEMDQVERIQEFNLDVLLTEFGDDEPFPEILLSRAPRLRNLAITTVYFSEQGSWPLVPFDGDTPALRTLTLINCPAAWYSFKLSGLTTLTLDQVPPQFQQNMEEFLTTLSFMQDLRHLDLLYALPDTAGFPSSALFDSLQKIDLPQLSRLWISDSISKIITFLSCVNIPLKTQVKLCLHYGHEFAIDDHVPLCSLLSRRFHIFDDQAPSIPKLRSLVMHGRDTLLFNTLECDISLPTLQVDWDDNIPLHIDLPFHQSMTTNDRERIISDICCRMPLTNVQSLYSIKPPFSSAFWRKTLGHLQHLRFLILSLGPMPDLVSVLAPIPQHPAENQHGDGERVPARVLASTLERLHLYQISFSSPANSESHSDTPPPADIHSLYDALSTRKESRGHLTMVQCVVTPHVLVDASGMWTDGYFLLNSAYRRNNGLENEGN